MFLLGLFLSGMSLICVYRSIRHAYNDDYECSSKSEMLAVLWLIAALIVFK